jgi:excisionase family DNA binding protein
MTNFKEYITVKQAAGYLGVTVMSLHRWDANGKLKAHRHPINRYRLYKKSELKALLVKVKKTKGN